VSSMGSSEGLYASWYNWTPVVSRPEANCAEEEPSIALIRHTKLALGPPQGSSDGSPQLITAFTLELCREACASSGELLLWGHTVAPSSIPRSMSKWLLATPDHGPLMATRTGA
jgi:hypothetical protein